MIPQLYNNIEIITDPEKQCSDGKMIVNIDQPSNMLYTSSVCLKTGTTKRPFLPHPSSSYPIGRAQ